MLTINFTPHEKQKALYPEVHALLMVEEDLAFSLTIN